MRIQRFFPIFPLMLALAACSGGSKPSSDIKEGENLSSNPIGQVRQFSQALSEFEQVQKELENMKPVDPLPFSDLMAMLPDAPAGWEAEKPTGESTQMGEWKFAQARRSYRSGDKTIDIEIQDWAYQYGLYAPFFLTASFSQETSEGYNKGIRIGQDPGREEYNYEGQRGTLSLLVGKRFLTGIKGSGIAAAELREWLDRLNVGALRAKAQP
jgi:hypothetical protein